MSELENKKRCVSGIVLGIIGIVFSLFAPAVTYSCSVTGLAISIKKRHTHNSGAAIVLNIVAISIAAINSICGILLTLKMFFANKSEAKKHAEKNSKNISSEEAV